MFLKSVRIIFQTLSIICYIVIFGFLLIMVPIIFGRTPVVVQSGSMEPAIPTGSIIYYHKVSGIDELKMGDVISFKTSDNKTMTTHRLMEIDKKNGTLRTKGDNNDTMDIEKLTIDNVVGKVGSVCLPKLGFVIVYAKEPLVIGMIALIIVGNVALSYLSQKSSKETEEEKSQVIH